MNKFTKTDKYLKSVQRKKKGYKEENERLQESFKKEKDGDNKK